MKKILNSNTIQIIAIVAMTIDHIAWLVFPGYDNGIVPVVLHIIGRLNIFEHPELTEPTIILNYISEERKIPPILIFHGTNDEIVPFGQSCMLYDKLKECKQNAEFYAVEGAHHGGREFWSNQVLDIIENFIMNN